MAAVQETVDRVRQIDVDQYRYGFETLIESDKAPKGLSEDTVRFISAKKNEPATEPMRGLPGRRISVSTKGSGPKPCPTIAVR
jgi:hypothetical protein